MEQDKKTRESVKCTPDDRLAVDVRYPNLRLSGPEWSAERIVIIPAEGKDAKAAKKEIRIALEWVIANLDSCIRSYEFDSVLELGNLRSCNHGG